ncbi:MAG: YqhA family protein [Sandaracinobacteroides sp.]
MTDEQQKPNSPRSFEHRLERGLFAARWLVVPFYLLLGLGLLILFVAFLRELAYYLPKLLTMETDIAILAVLTLIDLTLVANLVIIVMLASYETMVSRIDTDAERPSWMGSMGAADVKLKLFTSIVAISGIELLKLFMRIDGANPPSEKALYWLTIVHVVFVVTTLVSAAADWVQAQTKASRK